MNSLIYSEKELQDFINILPQLEKDELWFVSLSCRNKYLSDEERQIMGLSRTEMFAREFIYKTHIDNFNYILSKLGTELIWRRTKTNLQFPRHAMIVYFNLNPSSGVDAYFNFQKEMSKEVAELVNGIEKQHNVENLYNRFKNCMSVLKSNFQTSMSRKIFLDADFDTKNSYYVENYVNYCDSNDIKYFVVDTKNGFHVCMLKETVKSNIHQKLSELNEKLKFHEQKGEIILNSNLMIPMPGTLQANHKVRIIKNTIG